MTGLCMLGHTIWMGKSNKDYTFWIVLGRVNFLPIRSRFPTKFPNSVSRKTCNETTCVGSKTRTDWANACLEWRHACHVPARRDWRRIWRCSLKCWTHLHPRICKADAGLSQKCSLQTIEIEMQPCLLSGCNRVPSSLGILHPWQGMIAKSLVTPKQQKQLLRPRHRRNQLQGDMIFQGFTVQCRPLPGLYTSVGQKGSGLFCKEVSTWIQAWTWQGRPTSSIMTSILFPHGRVKLKHIFESAELMRSCQVEILQTTWWSSRSIRASFVISWYFPAVQGSSLGMWLEPRW